VLHGVNLLPFLPLGAIAMARLGLHASELRREASTEAGATAAPPA